MTRRINDEGLALIKQWEGLKLTAYLCPAKVWTIGYGSTLGVTESMKITKAKAEKLLLKDLERFEAAIERLVSVPLNDNQFAALVSWAFNVGEGAVAKSTLIRKLNAGDYDAVPQELARWNKAGGKVLTGLSNRRAAEAGLWAKGEFVASNYVEPESPEKNLAQSRTMTGATVAGVPGAGIAIDGVVELVNATEKAGSFLDGGSIIKIIVGLVILGGALYAAYARATDAGWIPPWRRA
jgi:lysozyme